MFTSNKNEKTVNKKNTFLMETLKYKVVGINITNDGQDFYQ